MAGLLDIAPLTEKVSVRGQEVEVSEISGRDIAMLLTRFPELRMLMAGREVSSDKLMDVGGDMVAAIIAAGFGQLGDTEYEAAAGRLGPDAQVDLLPAILRLTFPNGVGPFVEKLTVVGAVLNAEGDPSPKARATKLPRR